MKLLSSKRNKRGDQLVCEDAIFDPSLMTPVAIDTAEHYITFRYDFSESGCPLSLPFDADEVVFGVRLTNHDIHTTVLASISDGCAATYRDYINDVGDIEFYARMDSEEKFQLLLAFCQELFDLTQGSPTVTKVLSALLKQRKK